MSWWPTKRADRQRLALHWLSQLDHASLLQTIENGIRLQKLAFGFYKVVDSPLTVPNQLTDASQSEFVGCQQLIWIAIFVLCMWTPFTLAMSFLSMKCTSWRAMQFWGPIWDQMSVLIAPPPFFNVALQCDRPDIHRFIGEVTYTLTLKFRRAADIQRFVTGVADDVWMFDGLSTTATPMFIRIAEKLETVSMQCPEPIADFKVDRVGFAVSRHDKIALSLALLFDIEANWITNTPADAPPCFHTAKQTYNSYVDDTELTVIFECVKRALYGEILEEP